MPFNVRVLGAKSYNTWVLFGRSTIWSRIINSSFINRFLGGGVGEEEYVAGPFIMGASLPLVLKVVMVKACGGGGVFIVARKGVNLCLIASRIGTRHAVSCEP